MGVFVLLVLLAYAVLPLKDWLMAIARELSALGVLGVVTYGLAYASLSLVFFPAALLSITAGVTWGTFGGLAVALPSATLAATTAFLTSRYAFSGRFRAWVLHRPKLHAVDRAVNAKGAALVMFLRLSPVLPFPILNYAIGLTHIRALAFIVATFFGMMPVTLLWTWVGAIGAELGGLDGAPAEVDTLKLVAGAVGGVITLAVSLWVGRTARQAVREAEAADRAAGPDLPDLDALDATNLSHSRPR
jgi:uncharacterized membrane protein YdjX (TVP38/TMEM64 family)